MSEFTDAQRAEIRAMIVEAIKATTKVDLRLEPSPRFLSNVRVYDPRRGGR